MRIHAVRKSYERHLEIFEIHVTLKKYHRLRGLMITCRDTHLEKEVRSSGTLI